MNAKLTATLISVAEQIKEGQIQRDEAADTLSSHPDARADVPTRAFAIAYTAGNPDEWASPAHSYFTGAIAVAHHYGRNTATEKPRGDVARILDLAKQYDVRVKPLDGETHLLTTCVGRVTVRYRRDGGFRDAARFLIDVQLPLADIDELVALIIHHKGATGEIRVR